MKREDFYIQEATKYSQSETLNAEALAFIAGMKMADSHPNWIKASSDKQPEAGQLCVIATKTPNQYYLARWNDRTHVFELLDSPCGYYRSALDYWMQIELPKDE